MNKVEQWIVTTFKKSIHSMSNESDRTDILAWLILVREVLKKNELSTKQKARQIYEISNAKDTVKIILRSIKKSFDSYKDADISLALKIAIPVTLAAATAVGGAGVGIAGFGSAIGLPVLVLVFIGTSGITAILESFITSKESQTYISSVIAIIVQDNIYLKATKTLQKAMVNEPAEPKEAPLDNSNREKLKEELLKMDSFAFEQHVMSFFQKDGMLAWLTKKSNDAGVDGFAKAKEGLIVVQCKRYAQNNLIGRPYIQQFKGVIEENEAYKGYLVTTSFFTKEAKESALKNERLVLVDMDTLLDWHL